MIIFNDTVNRSLISRLDPRIRIASALMISILICLCTRPNVLIAGIIGNGLLLCVSGTPLTDTIKKIAKLNLFMLLLIVTMPLLIQGDTLLQIVKLRWSAEGLIQALLVAARANSVMFALIALTGTMEITHLGFGLSGLGIPSKFVHIFLFMIRYIELIHHEYHHLRDAMLLRAFRARCNRHTLRSFGFLTGQLIVRSVNRSERIMEAMKCRGFRGQFYILAPCHIEKTDVAFLISIIAGVCALGLLEWWI